MRELLLCLLTLPLVAVAQRFPENDLNVVSQVRIDMRELGYPPVDVIPPDESAIRALAVAPNGAIYGATSGKRSHLFVLHPLRGYVQPLGFLKGVTEVRALAVSNAGELFIGAAGPGGHLFKYTPPKDEDTRPIRVDAPVEVTDLGAPVPSDGIHALTMFRLANLIYGLTYPNGHFFSFDGHASKFTVHGKVAEHNIPGEHFEKEKNVGRAIGVDANGLVFTSGEDGVLFRLATPPERLRLTVSSVPGREPYNRVDAWAADACGILYGGTNDGYLFRFDPKKLTVENLGKPLMQSRIRGLVFSSNGKLYGVGGDDDEMARLFSYDPARGTYEILGIIDVNRRPFYSWRAYVIDAMAIGLDDTIYLGQAERKSKLYLYYPEPRAPASGCVAAP
jgi:hypothetical protein